MILVARSPGSVAARLRDVLCRWLRVADHAESRVMPVKADLVERDPVPEIPHAAVKPDIVVEDNAIVFMCKPIVQQGLDAPE